MARVAKKGIEKIHKNNTRRDIDLVLIALLEEYIKFKELMYLRFSKGNPAEVSPTKVLSKRGADGL